MFKMHENMVDLVAQFYLPFGGKLNPENRWIHLSQLIPWDKVEQKYVEALKSPVKGKVAYSVRVALGSLLIKERLGLSDRETTLQIAENPYLQFFIGHTEFVDKEPSHHSLMTHFRERLGPDILMETNEWIIAKADKAENAAATESVKDDEDDPDDPDDGQLTMVVGEELSVPDEPPTAQKKSKAKPSMKKQSSSQSEATCSGNKGKLLLDATCASADIKYPTDLGLLNHAREMLENIIDTLHEPHIGRKEKPRTYRHEAPQGILACVQATESTWQVDSQSHPEATGLCPSGLANHRKAEVRDTTGCIEPPTISQPAGH